MGKSQDLAVVGLATLVFSAIGAGVAGWITHIWWIFGMMMANAPLQAGRVLLAVLGVFIPPIGALHGIYLWFNAW